MPGIRSSAPPVPPVPLRYAILLAIAAFAFGAGAVRIIRTMTAKPAAAQSPAPK